MSVTDHDRHGYVLEVSEASPVAPPANHMLSEAMQKLISALELLDSSEAPAHIGAHVDSAIHGLYKLIANISCGDSTSQVDRYSGFQ